MNVLGGQYLPPPPLQPNPGIAALAAALANGIHPAQPQPGVAVNHVEPSLQPHDPGPALEILRGLLGHPAPVSVGNPAANQETFTPGPQGGFGQVSRGNPHPMHTVTVHLQPANPNLIGDHGYTHPVGPQLISEHGAGQMHLGHPAQMMLRPVQGGASSAVPRSGFYTPNDAPGWVRAIVAALHHPHYSPHPV